LIPREDVLWLACGLSMKDVVMKTGETEDSLTIWGTAPIYLQHENRCHITIHDVKNKVPELVMGEG